MEGPILVTQRELIEWIQVTKQNNAAVAELMQALMKGNGKPAIVAHLQTIDTAIDSDNKQTIAERMTAIEGAVEITSPKTIAYRVDKLEGYSRLVTGVLGVIGLKTLLDAIEWVGQALTHGQGLPIPGVK